jgi:hypothetical protein
MRQKLNKAVACDLLWDNAVFIMKNVCTALNIDSNVNAAKKTKKSNGYPAELNVDDIIIGLEWWLGQLVYLKYGRRHEARAFMDEIMESAMISFERQPDLFKACEKKNKIKDEWKDDAQGANDN